MNKFIIMVLFIVGVCACSPLDIPQPTPTNSPIPTSANVAVEETTQTPTGISQSEAPNVFGYTHHMANGNHFVEGSGSLPRGTSLEVGLDGTPVWVVAVPYEDTSLWAVVLEDGRVQAFWVNPGEVSDAQITPNQLNPGSPPLLFIEDGTPKLGTITLSDPSLSTHPIYLPTQRWRAFIHSDGSLILMDEFDQITATLAIDALPDARILSDASERVLVLSGPSTKYDHGVLGDQIEATSITLIETLPEPLVISTITVPMARSSKGLLPFGST